MAGSSHQVDGWVGKARARRQIRHARGGKCGTRAGWPIDVEPVRRVGPCRAARQASLPPKVGGAGPPRNFGPGQGPKGSRKSASIVDAATRLPPPGSRRTAPMSLRMGRRTRRGRRRSTAGQPIGDNIAPCVPSALKLRCL